MDTSSESTLPAAERPMPRYIRRSLLPLAVDDPALDGKAFGSWADAIVLDLARPPGVDWQAHARARMPAAIAAAARGGAEVFVRVDASAAGPARDPPPGVGWQAHARARMPAAIAAAARGGAEVFVRVDASAAVAEIDASVFTGLAGIVVKGVRDPQVLVRADEQLTALESS